MNFAVEDIFEISEWFLHTKPMTHKKLQKLLYFSYGIYLVQNNEDRNNITDRLFPNNFEAWVHGPVDPTIYDLYKYNGINWLFKEETQTIDFNDDILLALNTTMELYGNYDADELEELTQQQMPWINARKGLSNIESSNNPLDDAYIYDTFSNILIEG